MALTIKPSPRKPHLSRSVSQQHCCGTASRDGSAMRTPLSVPRRQRRSETSEHSALALTRGPPEPGRAPVQRIDSVVVRPSHPRATARGRPRRPSRRAPPLYRIISRKSDTAGAPREEWCPPEPQGEPKYCRPPKKTRTLLSTRHGRGSSLPGRPAPQAPRKGDGLRNNRLYLALVAPPAVSNFIRLGRGRGTVGTWLILPVVICLSQRLSHAGLSTGPIRRNCEWLIKSVMVP